MIKIDFDVRTGNTDVDIQGRRPTILTEFSTIVDLLDKEFGKEYIDYAIKLARTSVEETRAETEKNLKSLKAKIDSPEEFSDLLKAILGERYAD